MHDLIIRDATVSDGELLSRMFVEAALWRPEWPKVGLAVLLQSPELTRYFGGWGRPGDVAVVAAPGDEAAIGAGWFRLFTEDEPGYAFVNAEIPEIGLAVEPLWRRRGAGRLLLGRLQDLARQRGHPGLSLSVHPENPARRLYEAVGFSTVASRETEITMLWRRE